MTCRNEVTIEGEVWIRYLAGSKAIQCWCLRSSAWLNHICRSIVTICHRSYWACARYVTVWACASSVGITTPTCSAAILRLCGSHIIISPHNGVVLFRAFHTSLEQEGILRGETRVACEERAFSVYYCTQAKENLYHHKRWVIMIILLIGSSLCTQLSQVRWMIALAK